LRKQGDRYFADNVCAWAVSAILIEAGFPISQCSSTYELNQQLAAIGAEIISKDKILPGDVVFTGTPGGKMPHTYIANYYDEEAGKVFGYGEPGTKGPFREQAFSNVFGMRVPGTVAVFEEEIEKGISNLNKAKLAFEGIKEEVSKISVIWKDVDKTTQKIIDKQNELLREDFTTDLAARQAQAGIYTGGQTGVTPAGKSNRGGLWGSFGKALRGRRWNPERNIWEAPTLDVGDYAQTAFMGALQGLGQGQSGRAAIFSGLTSAAGLVTGPWGVVISSVLGFASKWFKKKEFEKPQQVYNVRVINPEELASEFLKITQVSRMRESGAGLDAFRSSVNHGLSALGYGV